MPDSNVTITAGTGTNIDTRTEATNSHHRQVVVIGDPSVNAGVSEVRFSDPDTDDAGLVVRDINTSAIAARLRDVRVQSIVDGTVKVGAIDRVGIVVDGTLSTVYRVGNVVDGTLSTVYRVGNVVDGTLSTVYRVGNVVDGTLSTVYRVGNVVDGTLSSVYRVHNLVDGTLTTLTRITETAKISAPDGTFAVYFSPSAPLVRNSSTLVISNAGGSVSGTVNTAGGSGANTIVSPEASRNIKVYAYSITTTAQVGISPRFTTGATLGATELWRVALQAPTQGIAGANLAVTPPGYLFSTGVGNTLAIYLDSASLVHYSIAYFKESA